MICPPHAHAAVWPPVPVSGARIGKGTVPTATASLVAASLRGAIGSHGCLSPSCPCMSLYVCGHACLSHCSVPCTRRPLGGRGRGREWGVVCESTHLTATMTLLAALILLRSSCRCFPPRYTHRPVHCCCCCCWRRDPLEPLGRCAARRCSFLLGAQRHTHTQGRHTERERQGRQVGTEGVKVAVVVATRHSALTSGLCRILPSAPCAQQTPFSLEPTATETSNTSTTWIGSVRQLSSLPLLHRPSSARRPSVLAPVPPPLSVVPMASVDAGHGPPALQRANSLASAAAGNGTNAVSPKASSLSLYRSLGAIGEGTFGQCSASVSVCAGMPCGHTAWRRRTDVRVCLLSASLLCY
jgi:hypothetical protein